MALKLHSHNPMTFTENHHGNKILGELQKQRMSSRFCDVFIAVNESKYPAHRCVLSACSPYFASLLIGKKVFCKFIYFFLRLQKLIDETL